MNSDCKFCGLAESLDAVIVGSVYVLPDAYPVTPGHHLIMPRRHCVDFFELTAEELEDTRRALFGLRDGLVVQGADGFNIGWNCGVVAGQTVAHAHCHLIPRRAGDMLDPTGGVRGVIPDRQKYIPVEHGSRI